MREQNAPDHLPPPGEDWQARFSGLERLVGRRAAARIARARVLVVGLGGVGGWTAEALARSGVGTIGLMDLDDLCISNTNRQIHALADTVGQPKIEVLARRMKNIHPDLTTLLMREFLDADTVQEALAPGWDVVVDAIDDLHGKCLLAHACRPHTSLIVCGGVGGRRDATRLRQGDLAASHGDALLKRMRSTLRRDFGWPADGPWGVTAVWSDEPTVFPGADGEPCALRGDGGRLDCATGFGTAAWVAGAAGLAAAGAAIDALIH